MTNKEQILLTNLCINALTTDGAHHKQWYIEQILFKMAKLNGCPEEAIRAAIQEEWEPGIAP